MNSSVKQGSEGPGGGVTALALTALGIVFGDIGTSPLYTLKTVIELAGGKPSPEVALGLLSLVIWTLLIVTSIKYVSFVMRVDNDGEAPARGSDDFFMQQGAAQPLDQVERAALDLVGAVDRQIDLPVRREGGQRNAQRRCPGRGWTRRH